MPPNQHALLSASSAHRWMGCTPSARLEQEFADQESEAAAEGSAAHALAEHIRQNASAPCCRCVPASGALSD